MEQKFGLTLQPSVQHGLYCHNFVLELRWRLNDNVFVVVQCDQAKNGAAACDEKQMTDYCQQHGFDAWFETSAKENVNIEEAARFLIARVSIVLLCMV